MSTATSVPETYELEGDDALRTLRSTGWGRLLEDSFLRFRAADGFSHSRALAYQVMLTLLPFVIAVVGLATALEVTELRQLITQAIKQGQKSAAGGGVAAGFLGALAALASATLAMGQIERGANRLYGVEQDRPTTQKYWNGFKLACTAGVLTVVAFMLIVGGADVAKATGLSGEVKGIWTVLRWPLSIAFVVVAFALLFREAPRRRQPSWSWLAVGSGVSVLRQEGDRRGEVAATDQEPAPTTVGEPATKGAPDAGTTGTTAAGPLLAGDDAEGFRARWTDVQNGFVDAPRQAVEQADGLVAELMQHLARTFSEERGRLESQWDRGDEVSTDDLRTAFQRYRSFFERLLAT